MNIDILQVQQFDNALRASIDEKQALIDEATAKAPQKITDVVVHHVLMPWQGTKHGTTFATFLVFEYHTDAGLVGLDESMAPGTYSEAGVQALRDRVVGKSPFDPAIRNILDIAYWDLVGKVVGRPLHEYLSDLFAVKGTRRNKVPFAAYTWARFPDMQGQGEVNRRTIPISAASWSTRGTAPSSSPWSIMSR